MSESASFQQHTDSPHPAGGLESGVRIGDFEIERRLGAGGMGIVYQARQLSLNRPVALKVLGQALSRGTDVTRFQREAQAAARLRHPSIAQVYYIGQDQHICYMAMELIEGISLRRVLDRLETAESGGTGIDSAVQEDLSREPEAAAVRFDSPTEALPDRNQTVDHVPRKESLTGTNPYLSPKARELRNGQNHVRRCAELVRDAAHALAHAHEQGVVHRDIKPDNLLLDRKGKVHLIDFGVARFFEDQAVTYTGQLVGTPLYMSPEQVTGRGTIDARSDLYSLGLVLYELLTLRLPVEATNRENLLRNIVTKPLPPVVWRNSAVPDDLARIVHRATQKDPDQRYASASELAADLDRYLAGKPVTAPAYHFRFDEREIVAARPGAVVLAAFNILLVAVCLFVGLGSIALMMGTMLMGTADSGVAITTMLIQLLMGVAILIGGIVIARCLLSAHIWARWAGVVVLAMVGLASVAAIVGATAASFLVAAEFDSQAKNSASQTQNAAGTVKEKTDVQAPAGTEPFPARNFAFAIFAMYLLPLVVGLLLGVAGLWGLLCRATGEWFRLAWQIRHEHRMLREQLQ